MVKRKQTKQNSETRKQPKQGGEARKQPKQGAEARKQPKQDSEATARRVADLALDRKAANLAVIDVRSRSSYTDFLVIASGTSDRHVQSVAEGVAEGMKEHGLRAIGSEGLREGQWALVDFGSVVLHVFHEFTREVYQLEELWRDAPRLSVATDAPAKSRRR